MLFDKDSEGALLLKDAVQQKVAEFMPPEDGDDMADTLAEYLVVLLSKGRSKAEVREELNSLLEGGPEVDPLHEW